MGKGTASSFKRWNVNALNVLHNGWDYALVWGQGENPGKTSGHKAMVFESFFTMLDAQPSGEQHRL